MPTKGFFTQGLVVLFERAPTIAQITDALRPFAPGAAHEGSGSWLHGPSVVVPYRPEVNGAVQVDVVDAAWPDGMGDPEKEVELFAAWSMGHFGPHAFPGGLARAAQQSFAWDEGATMPERHRAFVRLRASYAFGANRSDPVMPADYAPIPELVFVTQVARAVLAMPGALALFAPDGEALSPLGTVDRLLARHAEGGVLPQELWANVRMVKLADHEGWMLMDTVGLEQLDVPDHEALFAKDYDPSEVAGFLRNAADYVAQNGPVIQDGDTMDGPGGIHWQGATFEEPLWNPPRTVIRWFPCDDVAPPEALLGGKGAGEEQGS